MKKAAAIILLTAITILFASCSQGADNKTGSKTKTVDDVLQQQAATTVEATTAAATVKKNSSDKEKADVDLTELNSTMVYSEVYSMVSKPEDYIGKTVRMNGAMAMSKGDNQIYYACIIKDATACCSQGIEFVLKEGSYPAEGTDITVFGTFNTYKEGEYTYCQLKNAVIEA